MDEGGSHGAARRAVFGKHILGTGHGRQQRVAQSAAVVGGHASMGKYEPRFDRIKHAAKQPSDSHKGLCMRESMGFKASHAQEMQPAAEVFFRSKLGDVEESTAPFGLVDVRNDRSQFELARGAVEEALAKRARAAAFELGVNAATLFHVVWALVVANCSGRDDVVFGSVLSARLDEGERTERSSGVFVNTLPLRLKLAG